MFTLSCGPVHEAVGRRRVLVQRPLTGQPLLYLARGVGAGVVVDEVVKRVDAILELIRVGHADVVLVVFSDAGEVDERGDAGSLDHGRLADARELEEARTLDGAGRQDDLLGGRDGLAVRQGYTGRLVRRCCTWPG